jgi:hypothetical protein
MTKLKTRLLLAIRTRCKSQPTGHQRRPLAVFEIIEDLRDAIWRSPNVLIGIPS